MAKTKTEENNTIEDMMAIEDMPLNNLRDYRLRNEAASKYNKKARKCVYPLIPCPEELHPKIKIKFANNDKSINPVSVFLSNHLIHYDKEFIPGNVYEVPECIAHYLSEKGYPVWGHVEKKDGSSDTVMVNKTPRFSITPVWEMA